MKLLRLIAVTAIILVTSIGIKAQTTTTPSPDTVSVTKDCPIVGQWQYEGGGDYIYYFNADRTGKYEIGSPQPLLFTYEIKGDKLYILFKDNTGPTELGWRIEGNKLIIVDSFGSEVVYIKK